jgi:hypothetical protein
MHHAEDWVDHGTHALADRVSNVPVLGSLAHGAADSISADMQFVGGAAEGATDFVGGLVNTVAHPLNTAKGLEAVGEHARIPLVSNVLRAGHDLVDGRSISETADRALNPFNESTRQEDNQFWHQTWNGIKEPYARSVKEGRPMEAVGHGAFDLASMLVGAGEAGDAARVAEVASEAERASQVARVAGLASDAERASSLERAATVVADTDRGSSAARMSELADTANGAKGMERTDGALARNPAAAAESRPTIESGERSTAVGKPQATENATSEAGSTGQSGARSVAAQAAEADKDIDSAEQLVQQAEQEAQSRDSVLPSNGDPLRARYGPARESHPEEWNQTLKELKDAGVDIDHRPGSMAYSPARESPGRMILDPDASIGALRHETQHFRDIRAAGYPGMGPYLMDPLARWRLEFRAYMEEIKFARSQRDFESARELLRLMRQEKAQIFGEP